MTMWHFYRKQTVTWLRCERVRRGFDPAKGENKEWLAESLGGDDEDRGVQTELAQQVSKFVLENGGRWQDESRKVDGLEIATTFGTLEIAATDSGLGAMVINSRFYEQQKSHVIDKQFAERDFGWWCTSIKRLLAETNSSGPVRWSVPRRCFGCGVSHHRRLGCDPIEKSAYEARQKAIEAEQDAAREREILAILALPNEDWLDGFGQTSKRVERYLSDPRIKTRWASAWLGGEKRRTKYTAEKAEVAATGRLVQALREAIERHAEVALLEEQFDELASTGELEFLFEDFEDAETEVRHGTTFTPETLSPSEKLGEKTREAAWAVAIAYRALVDREAELAAPVASIVEIAPPITAKPRAKKRAAKLVSIAVEPEAPVVETDPWDSAPFVPMFQNR